MGIFDGLFGGGGSSQVTSTDQFKQLPKELQDMILAQAKGQTAAAGDMDKVRKDIANPNKSVAPLNPVEEAGLRGFVDDQDVIDANAARGLGAVNAANAPINAISANRPEAAVRASLAGLDDAGAAVAGGANAGRNAAGGAARSSADMRGIDIDALIGQYEDPFVDDVVNTTLSRFDEDLQRRQMQNEMQAAALGGTSNSRRAVADAIDQQLTTREKGATEAGLRSDAFTRSREMALDRAIGQAGISGDAGRLDLERAGLLADMGLNEGRFGLDRVGQESGTLLDLGDFGVRRDSTAADARMQQAGVFDSMANSGSARALQEGSFLQTSGEKLRGLDQARLDAPKDALTWFSGVSNNPQMPNNASQTVSSSGGNSWAQLAGAGLAAYQLSDEDAKKGAKPMDDEGDELIARLAADAPTGVDAEGLEPMTYEYREGHGQEPGKTAGFMADDVEAEMPGAVEEGPDGLKRVDPYPILAVLAKAIEDLKAGMK